MRKMSLTPDLVDLVTHEVPDPGPPTMMRPLSPEDRRREAERLVEELDGAPLWLFAYGSLIWKPAFEYDALERALVHGWRRSFCIGLQRWRGTPEQPGLMLALARGGSCKGVAYKMPGDNTVDRMDRLLEREVPVHEGLTSIRWVSARANGETFRALCFYCLDENDDLYCSLPLDQQVYRIARACGHAGSCAEYLHNTVSHLEELGIRDQYLWTLQHRVAGEIRSMFDL